MSLSLIRNVCGNHTALPFPYRGSLRAGQVAIVTGVPATVIANLGGAESVAGMFDVEPANDSQSPTGHDEQGAAGLPAGSVSTTMLADNAVTTAKITDANVTTAKIADANVTTAKILDANVTTAKLADANTTPAKLAVVDANGLGAALVIRKAFTAAGPGTADDVTIYSANAPFAFRILDVMVLVATNISGKTLQLRSAAAGAGSALSDALSATATGRVRDAGTVTATPSVAANGSLFLRRSDNGLAGEVIILIEKT